MSLPSRGANLLRAWRKRLNLSQSDAAQLMGMDMVQMSKYECGRLKPARKRANKIARITDGFVPASSWDDPDETNGGDDEEPEGLKSAAAEAG